MAAIILAGCCLICLIVSMIHEQRRFRNGIYFCCCIALAVVGIVMLQRHLHWTDLMKMMTIFVIRVVPIAACLMMIFVYATLITAIQRKKANWMTFFPAVIGTILTAVTLTASFHDLYHLPDSFQKNELCWVLMVLLYMFAMFGLLLIFTLMYSLTPKKIDANYIVIIGTALKHGNEMNGLLRNRCKRAMQLYEKGGRNSKLILSGGKTGAETITEAEVMKRYLLEQGIAEDDLLLEENSHSIYDNLAKSKEIVDRLQNKTPYKCFFIISEHHVLRVDHYAKMLHFTGEGVGALTPPKLWAYEFMEEYYAMMRRYSRYFAIWAAVWAVLFFGNYLFGLSV